MALPAAAAPEALELVKRAEGARGAIGFTATRVQQLQRQDMHLTATAKVVSKGPGDYVIEMKEPGGIAGTHLAAAAGQTRLFFPKEKLLFSNDNPAGSQFAEVITGRITDNLSLLDRNYLGLVMGDDVVAMTPATIIDLVPRRGYRTPGRRYWVDKKSLQVLREERRWAANMEPYFSSTYTTFVPGPALPKLNVAADVRKIDLKSSAANNYRRFASQAQAEATVGKLPRLGYVPEGFALREIHHGTIYGTTMTSYLYSDGVNGFTVMVRPTSNLLVGLIAGNFSLPLLQKFSDLSFHAPVNYWSKQAGEVWTIAWGDLYPDDLKQIVETLK